LLQNHKFRKIIFVLYEQIKPCRPKNLHKHTEKKLIICRRKKKFTTRLSLQVLSHEYKSLLPNLDCLKELVLTIFTQKQNWNCRRKKEFTRRAHWQWFQTNQKANYLHCKSPTNYTAWKSWCSPFSHDFTSFVCCSFTPSCKKRQKIFLIMTHNEKLYPSHTAFICNGILYRVYRSNKKLDHKETLWSEMQTILKAEWWC
jgi:hypothetical protein